MDTTSASEIRRITRCVVIGQILFTAGHSLTIGGFLNYFVNGFHPSAFLVALVQIAPESAESFSFLTLFILRLVQSRKWLWVCCLILGRACALLIPCALFLEQSPEVALGLIISALVLWHLFQGISYCSYISWLSDLVPEMNWGRFFSRRTIASLLVAIIVPTSAGLVRKFWINHLPSYWEAWSYAVIFSTGALLCIASVVPLLWIPDCPIKKECVLAKPSVQSATGVGSQFCWLLASRWWLAFFQGLTQGVLVTFSIRILKIGLEEYYILAGVMLAIQMGTAYWGGGMCDRSQDKTVLIWSLLGVSFAMWFWWGATPETKWLAAGAYIIWGGFGFVNVALENLTLKLAPRSENTLHISLARQGSGLVAGIAGLLGGFWLDQLLLSADWTGIKAYQLLFLISWVGRASALCWLLPIRQPVPAPAEHKSRPTP